MRFRAAIDGEAPRAYRGVDVDAQGWGESKEDRLYQLARQRNPVADPNDCGHVLAAGRAYVFTFG